MSERPNVPKPSQPAKEFFYRDGPLRADAELHNAILDDGDHDAAAEVSRARLKAKGYDDATIDRLIPRGRSKP
jgi:hypothetical protein